MIPRRNIRHDLIVVIKKAFMKTREKIAQREKTSEKKDEEIRKPGKSAHGKSGGDDDSSGGGMQGNSGFESDRSGSFGGR